MNAILVRTRQLAGSGLPGIVRDLVESVEIREMSRAIHMVADFDNPVATYLLIVECALASAFAAALYSKPAIRLVTWSAEPTQEESALASRQGAVAYLPATLAPMMMRRALQIVIAGGRYFPERLGPPELGVRMRSKVSALTPRQVEVLALLAAGKLNKEIAYELGMSAGTVKVHVTAILKALKMRNRTEAAVAMRDLFTLPAAREARGGGEVRVPALGE